MITFPCPHVCNGNGQLKLYTLGGSETLDVSRIMDYHEMTLSDVFDIYLHIVDQEFTCVRCRQSFVPFKKDVAMIKKLLFERL